jgi:hypothetical protein
MSKYEIGQKGVDQLDFEWDGKNIGADQGSFADLYMQQKSA